jgi:ribosome-binding ATPase YchF (GTP1/OBG family)
VKEFIILVVKISFTRRVQERIQERIQERGVQERREEFKREEFKSSRVRESRQTTSKHVPHTETGEAGEAGGLGELEACGGEEAEAEAKELIPISAPTEAEVTLLSTEEEEGEEERVVAELPR